MPEVIFGQPLSRSEAILQNMLGANNVLEPPMSREEYLLLQLLDHIGPSGDYYTKEEIDNMISAIEQEIDWKESVATFADLATTYPDAEAGWTASVLEDGRIYRYNGTAWIDIYGMIPLATSSVNGLMSTGKVIDLETVKTLLSGHSVASDVPANAVFTDTVYDDTALSGRVTAVEGLLDSHSVGANVPSDAKFTDTVYDDTALSGRVTTVEGLLDGHSVGTDVPSDAKFTDTVYDDTALVARVGANEDDIDDLQEWTSTSTKTVTGNPITINDGSSLPAKSLSMSIEPIQDLHGYDKPWAGGAGKNKLPLVLAYIKSTNTDGTWSGDTYTLNNVTFTVNTDNDGNVTGINVNGMASANAPFILSRLPDIPDNSALLLNGCPSGGTSNTYGIRYTNSVSKSYWDVGNGIEFTKFDYNEYPLSMCDIVVYSGVSLTNLVFYPMIRLSTETDSTFAPYSNICPPTGLTEASVEVTGKNLFDKDGATDGYRIGSDGLPFEASTYCLSDWISVDASTEYVRNKSIQQASTSVALYNANKGFIERVESSGGNFTTTGDTAFIRSAILLADKDTCQIEKGSTATPYEPYQKHTATIAFGQTVYGGQVGFETGVMTVTDVVYTYSSTDATLFEDRYDNVRCALINKQIDAKCYNSYDITGEISNKLFNGSALPIDDVGSIGSFKTNASTTKYFIVLPKDATLAEAQTIVDGLQVCYELATPFTVQLTPAQLELLKGNNTVTANGATITLEYLPNTLLSDAEIESRKYTDEKITTVLPTAPSTDGTYVLTCTVDDGEATLSWEAQS